MISKTLLTVSLWIIAQLTTGRAEPSNSVFIKRALPIVDALDSSEEFFPQRHQVDNMKAASVRIVDPSILLPPERRPTTAAPLRYVPSYEDATLPPLASKRQVVYYAGTPEDQTGSGGDDSGNLYGSGSSYVYGGGSGSSGNSGNNNNNCNNKCPEQSGKANCQDQCNYELVERRTFVCKPKDTVVQLLKSRASSCDSMAAESSSNKGRIGVIENTRNTMPLEIVQVDEVH